MLNSIVIGVILCIATFCRLSFTSLLYLAATLYYVHPSYRPFHLTSIPLSALPRNAEELANVHIHKYRINSWYFIILLILSVLTLSGTVLFLSVSSPTSLSSSFTGAWFEFFFPVQQSSDVLDIVRTLVSDVCIIALCLYILIFARYSLLDAASLLEPSAPIDVVDEDQTGGEEKKEIVEKVEADMREELEPAEQNEQARISSRWYQLTYVLFLFAIPCLVCSLYNLPYLALFLHLLFVAAFQALTAKHLLLPLIHFYVSIHLLMCYFVQCSGIYQSVRVPYFETLNADWGDYRFYLICADRIVKAGLFLLCCMAYNAPSAAAVDSPPSSGASTPRSLASHASSSSSHSIAVTPEQLKPPSWTARTFIAISYTVNQLAQHSLLSALSIFALLSCSLISLISLVLTFIALNLKQAKFHALAPVLLLYHVVATLFLYITQIFLSDSTMLSFIDGSLLYVFQLSIQCANVLVIAIYMIALRSEDNQLTPTKLYQAVCAGDIITVHKYLGVPYLTMLDNQHRTLLHMAAIYGHWRVARLLLMYIDCNAQDKRGNTALHYCYRYGYDDLIHLLTSHSCGIAPATQAASSQTAGKDAGTVATESATSSADIRNKKNQRASEMKRGAVDIICQYLRRFYLLCILLIEAHSCYIVLFILFYVAARAVNTLHMLYFLFFLTFFTFETLARRHWSLLLNYCSMVVLLLYAYILGSPYYGSMQDVGSSNWSVLVGFFFSSSSTPSGSVGILFSDLLWYWLLLFAVVVQHVLYTRVRDVEQESEVAAPAETGISRSHSYAAHSHAWMLADDAAHQHGAPSTFHYILLTIITYAVLVAVCLLSTSFFHFTFLLSVLLSLFYYECVGRLTRMFTLLWFACMCWFAVILLSMYAFLLPVFRDYVINHWSSSDFKWTDIGFQTEADVSPHTVLRVLVPPTACLTVTVLYVKMIWRRYRFIHHAGILAPAMLGSPPPSRIVSIDEPSQPSAPASIHLASVAPGGSQGTLGAIGNSPDYFFFASASSKNALYLTLLRVWEYTISAVANYAHYLIIIIIIFHVTFFVPISLFQLAYLCLALLYLPYNQFRYCWFPLSLLSITLICAKYFYQATYFNNLTDQDTISLLDWIGLYDFDNQLIGNLIGDLVILLLVCAQRLCQMHEERRLARLEASAAEPLPIPAFSLPPSYHHDTTGTSKTSTDLSEHKEISPEQSEEKPQPDQEATQTSEKWSKRLWRTTTDICYIIQRLALEAWYLAGLELVLIFLLLTSFARSNVFSLLYTCVFVFCFIVWSRRTFLRQRFILPSLLIILSVSIVYQYFMLLRLPAQWNVTFRCDDWDPVVQYWAAVGYFSKHDLCWDLFTYAVLCWWLPFWHAEPAQQEFDEAQWQQRKEGSSLTSKHSSPVLSSISTPQLRYQQPLLSQSTTYQPPSYRSTSGASSKDIGVSTLTLPSKAEGSGVLSSPTLPALWQSFTFYGCLLSDKLIFIFIFFVSTYHNNIFSILYLLFCLYYLYSSSDLIAGAYSHFHTFWLRLRYYNYAVIVILLLFQIPWIPSSFLPNANLRWEMTIGFHKFFYPPVSSSYHTADYLGLYTDPMSDRGGVLPVCIFFLVELELLILHSHSFLQVKTYYDQLRMEAALRGRDSTILYKESLYSQIQRTLLKREQLEASFTAIFLNAARIRADYFSDPQTWPQGKPKDWDEQVKQLLESDSVKLAEYEQKQQILKEERENIRMKDQIRMQGESMQPATQPAEAPQFLPYRATGPIVVTTSQTPVLAPIPIPPTSGQLEPQQVLAQVGSGPIQQEEQAEAEEKLSAAVPVKDEQPKKWHARLALWIKAQLIQYIDPTLWNEYIFDANGRLQCTNKVSPLHLGLFMVVYRFIVTHAQHLLYFAYFLNLLINANLLSLIPVFLILCHAMFERPRPRREFWYFCFLYTSTVTLVRFAFQLYIFCVSITNHHYILGPAPQCANPSVALIPWSDDYLFGLHKVPPSHNYFQSIVPDLFCLLCLIYLRILLMSRGLWNVDEEMNMIQQQICEEREQAEAADAAGTKPTIAALPDASADEPTNKALPRSSSTNALEQEMRGTLELLSAQESEDIQKHQDEVKQGTKYKIQQIWQKCYSTVSKYWYRYVPAEIQAYYDLIVPSQLFHGVNLLKPGHDFYLYLFLTELISAIWLLVCYDSMASLSSLSVTTSVSNNLFNGDMVLLLFLQIFLIIVDRGLYLFRWLTGKIILQYITVFFWHYKIFLVWPITSQSGFTSNSYSQFFYICKLAYFFISGLQIYTGYPPLESTSFQALTKYPSEYLVYIYKLYRAIPFVFELRTLFDWLCNTSALDLFDTFKLEDIHGTLYYIQCDVLYRQSHGRGAVRPWQEKVFQGILIFLLLLLIIFGPLLLFSTANPVSQTNNVQSSSISLALTSSTGEYPVLSISNFLIHDISIEEYEKLQEDDYIGDSDSMQQIQNVSFSQYSDNIWQISPPALQQLMNTLNDPTQPVSMRLSYQFNRAGPPTSKTLASSIIVPIDQQTQSYLAYVLNQTGDANVPLAQAPMHGFSTRHHHESGHPRWMMPAPSKAQLMNERSVMIQNVFPRVFRLPATNDPVELNDVWNRSNVLMTLDVERSSGAGSSLVRWWYINKTVTTDVSWPVSGQSQTRNLNFIVISNKIFAGPLMGLSYSIVAIYITVIFTIGQFVRMAFGNQVQRIAIDDLPNANKLMQITEGVYIARQKKELVKEEILYRRLIKIYRTPALLLLLTAREDSADAPNHNEVHSPPAPVDR